MATIERLINNAQALKKDIPNIIGSIIEKSNPSLIKGQQQQMLRGEKATGGKIGKYKNKSYRKKKFDMNPLAGYGNVDLRLKNVFQTHIKTYFFTRSFFFTSTDSKTPKLIGMYGEDIFGLNPKSRKPIIKQEIQPLGIKIMKQHLLA